MGYKKILDKSPELNVILRKNLIELVQVTITVIFLRSRQQYDVCFTIKNMGRSACKSNA